MIQEIRYKGEVIKVEDVEITWIDCFGESHTGDPEEYASDYASEQVRIAEAGEYW